MPHAVSASEAGDLLRAAGHDPHDFMPLHGGEWSTAFAFREGAAEFVVRFHERRDDLEKDRFAQRWASGALRTPRIVEISDLPEGAYGISERVRGTPLDHLDESEMTRVLPSLLAALDAMRTADLGGTHGYGLWHGDGNAEHASWRDALLQSGGTQDRRAEQREKLVRSPVGVEAFDAGLARMRELLRFCPEDRSVVHNDLLNFNVLADAKGAVLLDWGASIYGDFLYDAALLTFWWPLYERWARIDIGAAIERHYEEIGLVVPSFAERLRCCQLDIGVDHISYQAWRGRWDECAWTARRTLAFAGR